MKWFMTLMWDFFLIGGCAYVVFWKGHSPWWFILACCLLCDPDGDNKK